MLSSLLCRRLKRVLVYSLFDLDDNSFSLSRLLDVSIDELLDVFEIIGFFKKVKMTKSLGSMCRLKHGWLVFSLS